MRATYSGTCGYYKGVIKDNNDVTVWVCPHVHRNRDAGRETAARQCARRYLMNPEGWEKEEAQRVAWIESRRAKGWA